MSSKVYSEVDSRTYSQIMMKSGKDILCSVDTKGKVVQRNSIFMKIIKKSKEVSDLAKKNGLINTLSGPLAGSVKPLVDDLWFKWSTAVGNHSFLKFI